MRSWSIIEPKSNMWPSNLLPVFSWQTDLVCWKELTTALYGTAHCRSSSVSLLILRQCECYLKKNKLIWLCLGKYKSQIYFPPLFVSIIMMCQHHKQVHSGLPSTVRHSHQVKLRCWQLLSFLHGQFELSAACLLAAANGNGASWYLHLLCFLVIIVIILCVLT